MANVKLLKIVKKENPFVQIDKKNITLNRGLSFKAKGILCVLLGLDASQDFNLSDLRLYACDGESSTDSGLKELKQKGFLEVCRWREKNGKFGWGFNVYEIPLEKPVLRFSQISTPSVQKELKPSKVSELAQQLNIDESIVLTILNAQKEATGQETQATGQNEAQTDYKEQISKDEDFKAYSCKEYTLNPAQFDELLNKFFAQKSILNGSKKYDNYEALKTHVFNWLRVHITKNTPKTAIKTESTGNNKSKVIFEIGHYKKLCDNANKYNDYKEAVKNLLYWLEISFKNDWLTDEQKDRYNELKNAYNKAGELKKIFDRERQKTNIDNLLKQVVKNV